LLMCVSALVTHCRQRCWSRLLDRVEDLEHQLAQANVENALRGRTDSSCHRSQKTTGEGNISHNRQCRWSGQGPESEKEQYRAADGALSGECSPTSHSCIYKEYVLHQLKVVTSKNTVLEGKQRDIEQLVDRNYGTISERSRIQACGKAAEIERHCTVPALETAGLRAVERERYRQCSAVIRVW
jgi:hypothetical protein